MEITQYILGILATSILGAGWIGIQIIARKMKTKNHFDNLPASCSDFLRQCEGGRNACHDERIT
jgi:hypothetical protein